MTQQPDTPTIAGQLALARVLGDATRSLALLRLVRGASRRTQLRRARTAAMVLASAALLTAQPAAANVPSFVVRATDSFVDGSASIGFYHRPPAEFLAFVGAANGDIVEIDGSGTNSRGLANVGSFAAPTFADIDGDGDPDAIVGNGSGNLVYFANTGSVVAPAFAAPSTNPFGLGQVDGRAQPAFADLDGDGDLDALVGNIPGNTILFRNDGSATAPSFVQVAQNPFGLQNVGELSNPTFADADQDADLDAFIGNGNGDTVFFENTGSAIVPLFAAGIANPLGLTQVGAEASPEFADFDGDGDLDMAIGAADGTVTGFQNQFSCPPEFSAPTTNPFNLPQVDSFADPTFVDIDDDGDLDAFIGINGSPRIVFAENVGRARQPEFGPAVSTPFGLLVGTLFEVSPAFADIDGDGDLDAFIGEQYGNTLQFTNTGSATAPAFAEFPTSNPFGKSGEPFSKPTFGDIDNDGDLDVFVGGRTGGFFFSENTGSATAPAFAAPVANPFDLVDLGDANNPTLVDIDLDGDLDLVAGVANGDLIVLTNLGDRVRPRFGGLINPFGLTNANESSAPSFADIDGDGDPDALVGNFLGEIVFFENGGRRPPATLAPTPTATPEPTIVIVTVLPTETATATPTPTVTGSRPPDPTATATRDVTPGGPCVGDCSNNGIVIVNEIILGVNIALGSADIRDCPSFDPDGDGQVEIGELIQSVNNVLSGCP